MRPPNWITASFRDGVDARYGSGLGIPYRYASPLCWLAQHDPHRRPCQGRLERFHFMPRQRVRNLLSAVLPYPLNEASRKLMREIILLAEWDSRTGAIGCEGHHRRFDSHITPKLTIPYEVLPLHVLEYGEDWGFDLTYRFPPKEKR